MRVSVGTLNSELKPSGSEGALQKAPTKDLSPIIPAASYQGSQHLLQRPPRKSHLCPPSCTLTYPPHPLRSTQTPSEYSNPILEAFDPLQVSSDPLQRHQNPMRSSRSPPSAFRSSSRSPKPLYEYSNPLTNTQSL